MSDKKRSGPAAGTPAAGRRRSGSRRRVWLHRALAAVWVLLAIPGVLWWAESILFVILVSLYANYASEIAAAEAADDQELAQRLDRIEKLLLARDGGRGEG